ncbi:MAG: hypothetical protein IPL10_08910 [Bacteroidetes bacterium]|nr:hypothetical protein [Bacteroidota bacterium]
MTEKEIGNYLVKFNFDKVEIDFSYTKRIVFEIIFYGIAGILFLLSPLLAQNSFVVYYQLGSIILVIGGVSVLSIAAKRLFTPRQEIIVIDKTAQTLTFKKID